MNYSIVPYSSIFLGIIIHEFFQNLSRKVLFAKVAIITVHVDIAVIQPLLKCVSLFTFCDL